MATRHNPHITCNPVKLQHSRAATDNLMKLMSTENTEITFIQEPYLYRNKPKGITSGYRTYTHGEGKSRGALIINDTLDTLLIIQLSDSDTVLLEIHKGRKIFYAVIVYMDYNESIENNLQTLQNILEFTGGAKLIIAIDSNAVSKTWYGVTTNYRGKILEELVASYQLHIVNEDSPRKTFQISRGSSNIDLTIVNNQMLPVIKNWEKSEEESVSDHNILIFNINFENDKTN